MTCFELELNLELELHLTGRRRPKVLLQSPMSAPQVSAVVQLGCTWTLSFLMPQWKNTLKFQKNGPRLVHDMRASKCASLLVELMTTADPNGVFYAERYIAYRPSMASHTAAQRVTMVR